MKRPILIGIGASHSGSGKTTLIKHKKVEEETPVIMDGGF